MVNRYEPTGKTCLVTGGAKRIHARLRHSHALSKHQARRVILVVLRIGPSCRNRANA